MLNVSSRLFISSCRACGVCSWFSMIFARVSSIPLSVCSRRASTSLRSSSLSRIWVAMCCFTLGVF